MRIIIDIEIEDNKLRELGIDQKPTYTPFYFHESKFIGYWFDGDGESIHTYIGSDIFLVKNSKKNIDLFNSILNK